MYNKYTVLKHAPFLWVKALVLLVAYACLSSKSFGEHYIYEFICGALITSAIYTVVFMGINGYRNEHEVLLSLAFIVVELSAVLFIIFYLHKQYSFWYTMRYVVLIWLLKEGIVQLNFALIAWQKSKIAGGLFLATFILIALVAFDPIIRGYGTTMGNQYAIIAVLYLAILNAFNAFYFGRWKKIKTDEAHRNK